MHTSRTLDTHTPHRAAGLFLGLLGAFAIWGCGASQKPAASHETFRAVQSHEAGIDRALRTLDGADEAGRCASLREATDEVEQLCGLAATYDDLDLQARCDGARARCERAGGCGQRRAACDGGTR